MEPAPRPAPAPDPVVRHLPQPAEIDHRHSGEPASTLGRILPEAARSILEVGAVA